MTDPLKPLQDLAHSKREHITAKEITPLLPALEAAFREACRAALLEGRDEAEQRNKAEIAALKDELKRVYEANATNARLLNEEREHTSLERAMLRPVAELVAWYKENHPTNPWPAFGYPNLIRLWLEVNEIVTDSDRSAHDAEVHKDGYRSGWDTLAGCND